MANFITRFLNWISGNDVSGESKSLQLRKQFDSCIGNAVAPYLGKNFTNKIASIVKEEISSKAPIPCTVTVIRRGVTHLEITVEYLDSHDFSKVCIFADVVINHVSISSKRYATN